jgi:hypothetical protein
MSGRWAGSTFTLSLICAFATTGAAQVQWGSVRGAVTDPSGAAIPGATVIASSNTLPRGLTTATDERGLFLFPVLPVGRYTITVAAPGFHVLRYHNLPVRLGAQMTYNARLSLGPVTEIVEVNDAPGAMDTTSSQTATVITASEFDNVARGRSFHTVLMMAPGVRHEIKAGASATGGVSVDGASGSENAYYIDGVDVTDVISGALRAQNALPLEFVQQVQVKSGGFEAEFGGATGGVINVATRSGSNAFHGEVLLQTTSGRWNSSDRGYYIRSPLDASVAQYMIPRKDDYRILYPGFSAGGPILRDQVFAFLSYMPEHEKTVRTIGYASGARVYRSSRTRHFGIGRVDASPRPHVQASAAWVWSPARKQGNLPMRDPSVGPPQNDPSELGEYEANQTLSTSLTYSPTSRVVISARLGYKYLNYRTTNYGAADLAYISYRTPSSAAPDVPEEYSGAGGFQNNTGAFAITKDMASRYNGSFDVSRVSMLFGQQHILKAGYALNRVENDTADGYANGRFDVFWGETFLRGDASGRGRYGYYVWEDGPRHNNRAVGLGHALYMQDNWRALRRLTINAGVRMEREYLPPYTPEVNGVRVANPIDFGWGEKIAPRIGAAWDVRGDGRWKASGSYGIFYDLMKYSLAREAFGGDYWFSHVYRLDAPHVFSLSLADPGALGERIASFNNRSLPINERGELTGIDPAVRPYSTREITLTLDRQIGSRLQAGVRYTRKTLLRAIEDIGLHDANHNEVYLIGNPGFGRTRDPSSPYGAKTPDGQEYLFPRAKRTYDGLEFRLEGQLGRTHVVGSYTLSRLWGNYAGLANSDEAGRMEPSISRSFDLPTYYFDSSGSQRNVEGRLATDRPHVFKLFAWREFRSRFGVTDAGVTQVATSGSLDSTTVNYMTGPTFPFGRGDLGRNPVFTQTDLNVAHTIDIGERVRLKFEATAMNLLNQAAVISRVTQLTRNGNITAAHLPVSKFFEGYDLWDYVGEGRAVAYNPIYGLPGGDPSDGGVMYRAGRNDLSSAFLATNPGFGAYQGPRTLRLGIRVTF